MEGNPAVHIIIRRLLLMLPNATPIRKKWFYNLYGYKTKLNWLLMEIALEYYDHIKDSPELWFYRELYNDKQIAQYCTYYVRRLKESLLKYLRGQRKRVMFYWDHIEDFYPHHTEEQNKALGEVGMGAFDHMVSGCVTCPHQCLKDYSARCMIFEDYEDKD